MIKFLKIKYNIQSPRLEFETDHNILVILDIVNKKSNFIGFIFNIHVPA